MLEHDVPDISLRSFLGSGGFGEVWSARHIHSNARVAVKLLHPTVPDTAVAQLAADAQLVSRIAWSGLARLWWVGPPWYKRPYIVSDFVEGEAAAHRAHRCSPAIMVADIVHQASIALGVAARFGAYHGHLNTSNLILVPDRDVASGERVVVTDLGSRRLVELAPALADPRYLAPEQFMGAGVDGRADVYALGCIAFELACGRPPFPARSFQEARARHLGEPVPPPRTIVPDMLLALERLLLKMLAKDPAKRPALTEVTKLADVILGMEGPIATTRKAPVVR